MIAIEGKMMATKNASSGDTNRALAKAPVAARLPVPVAYA